jgi:predicted rRNA methylase YqxC with S4 and FtsJ domains
VNDKIIKKVSYDVSEIDIIKISESPMLEWVSRSAGKLDGFFQELGVETLA